MGNANTPYVAKAAAPLVNPVASTVFTVRDANAAVSRAAFAAYNVYQTVPTSIAGNAAPGLVNCVPLKVRAWGRATGGTTTNWTPTLQFGNSVTSASNTTVAALTAGAFNTASGSWYIEATLLWDAVSGQIVGYSTGTNATTGTLTANAAITAITGQTATATLYFVVAGLFSATNANNIAYLDGLEVEEV